MTKPTNDEPDLFDAFSKPPEENMAGVHRSIIFVYLCDRLGQTVNRRDIQHDTGIENVQARIHELMQWHDIDGQGVLPKVDGAQLYRLNSLEPKTKRVKEWGVEMRSVNGELEVWAHDKAVDKASVGRFVAALRTFAAQWWGNGASQVESVPQAASVANYDTGDNYFDEEL